MVVILGLVQVFSVAQASKIVIVEGAGLDMGLAMGKDQYSAADPLTLEFTIRNTADEAVTLLKWETPLEGGFAGNMLSVKQDGEAVPYIGKLVKRAEPQESDFITISAGDTVTASLDLSAGYAIKNTGKYTVEFSGHISQRNDNAGLFPPKRKFKAAVISANAVSFELSERKTIEKYQAKDANFLSCNTTQKNTLNSALAASVTIATESKNSLNNTPVSDRSTAERYVTWFGQHTTTRYNTVKTHFTNIHNALANEQVVLNCDCDPAYASAFAYVTPSEPYKITLCNAFWAASLNGHDSKAGTLIHEASHFNIVADTDDHAYGTGSTQSLAISSPDTAIDNADNHEYFAENTPALTMGAGTNTGSGDTYEPNNSSAVAKIITAGNSQSHSLVPVADQDWIMFTLSTTSNITLETSGVDGDDTEMSLYNANQVLIAENDDISESTNRFSRITKSSLAAGTYYVKINEYENDDQIAAYTVFLAVENIGTPTTPTTPTTPSTSSGGGAFSLGLFYLIGLLGLFKMLGRRGLIRLK